MSKERTHMSEESNWNFARAERSPSARTKRVVVSVAFPQDDFEKVAARAEQLRLKTSEFIRLGALEKAGVNTEVTRFTWYGGTGGIILLDQEFNHSTLVSAEFSEEPNPVTV